MSLLPIISKIIEKLIHDQTLNYLMENKIRYRYKSGLCKKHPTNTSFLYLTDEILRDIDSGLLTGMILINLKKAFNIINDKILLRKYPVWDFQIINIVV